MKTEWQAHVIKNKKYSSLLLFTAILVALSLIGGVPSFFLFALIIGVLLLSSHLYLSYVYQPIQAEASWSHLRLFPDEHTKLHLKVINHGKLGVQGGTWSFRINKKMNMEGLDCMEGALIDTYQSSFTLGRKEGVEYEFTATAKMRGVVYLEDMLIEVKDPFELGLVKKEVRLPTQEILIYPKLVPISKMNQLSFSPMGERSVQQFTFEDPTFILGSRPYQHGDPFHRIDWKTTARKQELYTKRLDHTVHTEFVLIGNVRTYEERWRGINHQLVENALSIVASISEFAVQQDVPFQSVINMKPIGKRVFRIPRGEGRKHFIHTLESLARVSVFSTLSYEETVFQTMKEYKTGQVMILITPYITAELNALLTRMEREGVQLYMVRSDQEPFVIEEARKELKKYA